jgi:hypothetical protein
VCAKHISVKASDILRSNDCLLICADDVLEFNVRTDSLRVLKKNSYASYVHSDFQIGVTKTGLVEVNYQQETL